MLRIYILLSVLIVLCGCSYPSSYCIRFDTDIKGEGKPIIINVTQSWSPNGANHLFDIINSHFYSVPSAFFRVVPNFVLQFGISGDPIQNTVWNKPIPDGFTFFLILFLKLNSFFLDPVLKSNTIGTVSYATAGPNTRTTQLFINYINNSRLDPLGFSPFGRFILSRELKILF
jgi:peptidyl-prolyl cis-trans isomerase A (cyclophilin A)